LKYSIRFNKTKGQEGKGTPDHCWQVFEENKEYLFKNVQINTPCQTEKDQNGNDWNFVCNGLMTIDRETSTAVINECDSIESCAYWKNAFSKEECEKIISLGVSLSLKEAKTFDQKFSLIKNEDRDSYVSWIDREKESKWIYDRLQDIVFSLNDNFFKFDILGFGEKLQFTCYEAPSGKYGTHLDRLYDGRIRKLSLSVQLSDPDSYEGGDLVLHYSKNGKRSSREQGHLTLFPSYTLHEVEEVTQGTRYSLVAWITGKPFK
jgi:PKHD-type hydroxylase